MENILLILIIVLLVLVLALSVLFFVFLNKWKKTVSSSGGTDKTELLETKQEILNKIELLEADTKSATAEKMDQLVSEQKLEIQKNFNELNLQNARNLDSFKTNLQQGLSSRLSEMDSSLKDQAALNSRNLDSFKTNLQQGLSSRLNEMEGSLKEQAAQNTRNLSSFQTNVLNSLNSSIGEINKRIDTQFGQINERVNSSLNDGFKNARDSLSSVQKELGALEEARRKMDSLTDQISSLGDVLSNSQKRGKYGEFQLESLLGYIFGENMKGKAYDLQYVLRKKGGEDSGLRPDAVVFLGSGEQRKVLCLDSKFSLVGYESLFNPSVSLSEEEEKKAKALFKSALKQRIEETGKYVGAADAMPSAVMFIPNDGVFAFAESEFPDLVKEAYDRRVVLTCPSILEPLLAAYRMVQINDERLKQLDAINRSLDALGKEFNRLYERWDKLSAQIDALSNKKEDVGTTVLKLRRQFDRIQVGHPEIAPDSPDKED